MLYHFVLLEEQKMYKCKDHLKGIMERKQNSLEEFTEVGLLDEVFDMEKMYED